MFPTINLLRDVFQPAKEGEGVKKVGGLFSTRGQIVRVNIGTIQGVQLPSYNFKKVFIIKFIKSVLLKILF